MVALLVISTLKRQRQKDHFELEEPGSILQTLGQQRTHRRPCLNSERIVIWWLKRTLWIVQLSLKELSKLFILTFLNLTWSPLPCKRLRILKHLLRRIMVRCKCFKVHQGLSEMFNKWDQDNKTSQQSASLHCVTEYTTNYNLASLIFRRIRGRKLYLEDSIVKLSFESMCLEDQSIKQMAT